jgi:hypothetical protein
LRLSLSSFVIGLSFNYRAAQKQNIYTSTLHTAQKSNYTVMDSFIGTSELILNLKDLLTGPFWTFA